MRVRELPLRETTHDLLAAIGTATVLFLTSFVALFTLQFAGVLY